MSITLWLCAAVGSAAFLGLITGTLSVRRLVLGVMQAYKKLSLLWLRLRGHTPSSLAEERLLSGRTWEDFCDTLKGAGAAMLAPGTPKDAFNQAEGYRYLSRLVRAGLENYMECADPDAPVLVSIADGHRAAPIKIGADNPDNLYQNAILTSKHSYLVSGRRGGVAYLGFGTQQGSYGAEGGLSTVDYIEADQLHLAADGSFELVLSAERPAGCANHLRLEPAVEAALFIVRQTFNSRTTEAPAEISISRLGAVSAPSPLSVARVEEALHRTSLLVAGAPLLFAKWASDFQKHSNELPLFDQKRSDSAGGDPNIRYFHSHWAVPPGSVLRIRARPPKCRFWNFQLNNYWMESLDYRYFPVHVNGSSARPDSDDPQGVTILVCHEDPNDDGAFRGNWVSTVGHDCGTMCFRWVHPAPEHDGPQLPRPSCEVIPISELTEC